MNQKQRSFKLVGIAALFLLLVLAFAGPVAAQEGVTYITEGDCISAASGNDRCSANDVTLGALTVTQVIEQCDSTTDTFTALVSATVDATALGRFDIGMWIGMTDYAAANPGAQPGDGARFGDSCYRQILSPVTTTAAEVNPTSGEGPYASLDGDFCGDVQQGVSSLANLPYDDSSVMTLPCADPDNDGVANIDACVSWENNPKVTCANVTQALPGSPAKCSCGSFAATGVDIRKIIVDKVTPQSQGSEQAFPFTLSAVEDAAAANGRALEPVEFTLTDAQEPFVTGALVAGTYSVAEGAVEGWTSDGGTCVDAAGKSYDPAGIDLTGPAVTVTCTFTNTQELPPPSVGRIVVDKVTPQSPGSTQVFAFTLSAVEAPAETKAVFEPIQFTLTDAQEPFSSGDLLARTYSVVETDPGGGWTLEKAECVDDAGKTYDPAKIDLPEPAGTVKCTFTNTVKPPITGVPLPFSYLLIGGALLGAALLAAGALMQRKAHAAA